MSKHEEIKNNVMGIDAMSSSNWNSINPEYVTRMRKQNRFKTGLDIAKYTASIMRKDMEEYDKDSSKYTQSLGCWHGFIGQQKLISIKKHFKTTNKKYLYLSGWMIAALRSDFGPLPDQSMHEKTSVANLIEELYTFLRQADARELGDLYRKIDNANDSDKKVIQENKLLRKILLKRPLQHRGKNLKKNWNTQKSMKFFFQKHLENQEKYNSLKMIFPPFFKFLPVWSLQRHPTRSDPAANRQYPA